MPFDEMRKLYIIGNGFDLHHGLKTKYTDFCRWLKKNNNDTYHNLLAVYNLPDDIDRMWEWWSMFEAHLVDLDLDDEISDLTTEYSIDYGSDDFREGDRYAGAWEAETRFNNLMSEILDSFDSWVDSLMKVQTYNTLCNIDPTATFINFNYTQTLELLYGIPSNRVHHIHGKCGDGNYVLGHAKSYDEIKVQVAGEDKYVQAMTPAERAEWHSEHFDEVYENVVDATVSHLVSYRKDTDVIIAKHEYLFSQMADLEEIIIYGYSFSDIDNPYLFEILKRVNNKANLSLEVSFHTAADKIKAEEFFLNTDIKAEQIRYVRLTDYSTDIQLQLFN